MGMYVSQLRSVPINRYEYYAYLVDVSVDQAHSKAVDRFFEGFAKQSEVKAVIVKGPRDLSTELYKFLQRQAPGDFGRLESLFMSVTSLVISEGALQTTTEPVHVLPLLSDENATDESQVLDALLGSLLLAMREGKLHEFVRSLGAESLVLREIKGGMLIATLRRLNEVLELKPNIAGFGLNLNAIIEDVLGPSQRSLQE